ncbi:MAG: DUF2341 domain-containing protein [Candidatus Aenigmatarchaeota archaeon]
MKTNSIIIGTAFSFLFFLIAISIFLFYLNYNINNLANIILKNIQKYEKSTFEIIEILDDKISLPEIKIKNIGKLSLDLSCFKVYVNGNLINFSYEIEEILKDDLLNPSEIARIRLDNIKNGWNKIEIISCNGKKFEKAIFFSEVLERPWLEPWNFRTPIYILERSVQNLIDYQVLIILDTQTLISQGKMRSDCGDIRFTDSDGVTLLNYWIESGCNTNNTRIWVRVNLTAFSNKTIYLYYGNPDATSLSDISRVFIWTEREIFPNVPNTTWGFGSSNPEDTFNTYYHDARNEILIRPSDFGDLVPVNITMLRIYVVQQPGRDLDNYRVRYQLTTRTQLTNTFTTTGWILVFGPVNLGRPTAGTIVNLSLNPPIIWTNHSLNLLLDLSRDTNSWVSGGGMYRKLVNISNTMCTYYSDSARTWPFDGSCTLRDYVPSIIFVGWFRKYVNPEPLVILSNTEEKI